MLLLLAVTFACTGNVDDWTPAGDRIRTPWAEEVSPQNVHSEYPRPQMIRKAWKSLNGLWDYAVTAADVPYPEAPEGKILVPFCVESSLSGVGRRVGADSTLWYRLDFKVPGKWKDRVLLHFDAVDWKAEVWLNGQLLGEHTGGYTSFEFDITDYLVDGRQRLVLKVTDGTDNNEQPRGKQVSEPNGIWYTPVTGIWQSVWLEPVGSTHVNDYNCVWDDSEGRLTVTASLEGEADEVRVKLLEGGEGWDAEKGRRGSLVASSVAAAGEPAVLEVPSPALWSPEHPYLYALEIEALKDGKVVDKVKAYTALRTCAEVVDSYGFKRLGLNGEPYFQYGPLDQGWWPDGLYTAPTDKALAYDIAKTKEWGYNFIRKHIKVEPARWYYHCDRLGILVWQDMPSMAGNVDVFINDGIYDPQWGYKAYDTGWDYPLTETAKATYYKEWGEIMAQRKKFPCIVVWVPFNEAWGQFDTEAVTDFTREQDGTRLINPASGGNHRHCGDILDCHYYPKPRMRFRSNGEQIDVLGEYGGIGYAVEDHTWQKEGNWGYKGLCQNGDEVLEKYRFYALNYLLPSVMDGVSAAVYTQTTDVEGEVNGLMTYDRKVVKVNEAALREINLQVREAVNSPVRLMSPEHFREKVDGTDTDLYTLRNGDITMQVTNFGARVVSIFVPDKNGDVTSIVAGHDNIRDYINPPGERFLGACVGPVANRIGNASFMLDGKKYRTPVNDNGKNTLHGGFKGVDNLVWDVLSRNDTSIVLHLLHPDGLEGYPGNLDMIMTYALGPDNEFRISYEATTDKPTPVNFSNHPFFCLRGEGNGSVEEYLMFIKASRYLPIDKLFITTGEIASVEGTPFDFREPHTIGERIGWDNEQLRNARGYDHNWCIDKETDGVELMCRVEDPVSGRWVEVLSDQPGLQFYSGNFFDGKEKGANGNVLSFRSSLALEAQQYPGAVNHPEFGNVTLRPGEKYTQTCIYRFGY